MRTNVLAAVVLAGLCVSGPALARTPRCHVSFTQARPDFPHCSLTSPCIEGQPCASLSQLVDCGQAVSGCGKTFECRCPKPGDEAPKAKRPRR